VLARAKINLALDVLGRRPDGYHELRSLMQTLALCDRVVVRALPDSHPPVALACAGQEVPGGPDNLAYRAALLYADRYGLRQPVSISLRKRIPGAAGLAGGSSDGAAALLGLRHLFGRPARVEELEELALALGADVPFCLRGGTALAEGVGEQLTPLPDPPPVAVLLAKPPFPVATGAVFQALDAVRIQTRPDIDGIVGRLYRDLPGAARLFYNVLEPVTTGWHPEVARLKAAMLAQGALAALMSGSGPSVYGYYPSRRAALAAFWSLRRGFPEAGLFLTATAPRI
jgi:4-diphosphocytidyl-2-C-methyl-D-erythritol kinase